MAQREPQGRHEQNPGDRNFGPGDAAEPLMGLIAGTKQTAMHQQGQAKAVHHRESAPPAQPFTMQMVGEGAQPGGPGGQAQAQHQGHRPGEASDGLQ